MGRSTELGELLLSLTQAERGRGRLVLVEGEAGIGKTSLLREALLQAEAMGFRCWSGGADELERHRPFGAVTEALGIRHRGSAAGRPEGAVDVAAGILRLLRGDLSEGRSEDRTRGAGSPARAQVQTPGAPEAEYRIVDALIDYVEQLCADGPVAIAVEDLQWADASSLLALNRLSREVPDLPLLILATLRLLPRSPELEALLNLGNPDQGRDQGRDQAGRPLRIVLERLDRASVASMVSVLAGAPPGDGLLRQLDRAGGNPFFTAELLATLAQTDALEMAGGRVELRSPEGSPATRWLPASLTATVLHRLHYLSPGARTTLQVASVLGSSFPVSHLAALTGRPPVSLRPDLHEAIRGGILNGDTARLAFRHDLIRESLYQSMPQALRHALHLNASATLLEAGVPPEEVVEHVFRGADAGDLEAVQLLRTAAAQAGSRSPVIAAELLTRALELAEERGPSYDAAQADLALFQLSSGRLADSEALCRATLARPHDPAVEGPLRLCLVQACVGQGRVAGGLAEIALAVESPALTERERGRLWAWASTCRVIVWDLPGALRDADEALRICGGIEDELGTTVALAGVAAVRQCQGQFREALALGEEAVAAAAGSGSAEARRLRLTIMHALMLIDVDRFEDAQHALRQGRFAREQRGARWNLPTYHFVSALGRFCSGEWDEALAQCDSAADFAEEVVVFQAQLVAHSLRALIALQRDDLVTAERELAAAEAEGDASGPQWRPDWVLWAQALLAEAQGRPGEALVTLLKAWDLCSAAGVAAEFPVIGPDLVRLAMANRESIVATQVTEALESLAAAAGVASVTGAALRCRGLVSGEPAPFVAAADAYRASGRLRELGLACEDAAVALAATARGQEAKPLAEEALAIFQALDSRRDTARAVARLRSAGVRTASLGPRSERARPERGWDALTETEVRVAGLVAEGLNNPEIARRLFVSRRTVQTHASNILQKLGMSRRAELAAAATRWQAGGPPEPRGPLP
ncbi:MAG TPA: AAA family ATPase [Actinomycetota bacterium]|nr:AAA family ATPase [Actinomycetota bacterium]